MTKKPLRFGMIGLSEGNGHPYSWAAICNGYDEAEMAKCPFPVIPAYLAQQNWPEARLQGVEVTHIWTQDRSISQAVASASLIPNVCDNLEDMIPEVDAVLLARDDAENHYKMALPFLEAGLPVFIDKPLALDVKTANALLRAQQYEGQLFSCSSLRYAKELFLTGEDEKAIGKLRFIEAQIPKSWEKYSVHLLEPVVAANPRRGDLQRVNVDRMDDRVRASIQWKNLEATVSTYGKYNVPLAVKYFGAEGWIEKNLLDTFSAFKGSIEVFANSIRNKDTPIARSETLEIIQLIEAGLK